MRATTSCTPFAIEVGACSLCGAVEREPCARRPAAARLLSMDWRRCTPNGSARSMTG